MSSFKPFGYILRENGKHNDEKYRKTLFIRTLLPKYYSFIIYYKLYQPGNIINSYSKRDYQDNK